LALIIPPSGESVRTLVEAAIRFNKIGQALTSWPCPSCIPQHPGPFASGLVVNNLGIGRAENHYSERLGLHLRQIKSKAKGRSGPIHRTVELPPAHDDAEDGR
jgi:hypothetical protein